MFTDNDGYFKVQYFINIEDVNFKLRSCWAQELMGYKGGDSQSEQCNYLTKLSLSVSHSRVLWVLAKIL